MRRIISLWLPRFQAERPRQPGPFAVVRADHGGQRIACATLDAQEAGVAPGLPLADARALCPGLRTAEADPAADRVALERLADEAQHWTPWTAVEGLDPGGGGGLWLDITGCAHLAGGEEALMDDIVRRFAARGLAARGGLGDGKGAAWAAARFLDPEKPWAIIPEGANRQILPTLPIAALRLDAATLEALTRLGMRRVADLAALPRAPLAARFGAGVAQRLDQMFGRLPEPFSPRAAPDPWLARMAFAEPIARPEDIAAGLRHLLGRLCRRLEHEAQGARRLLLEAFRVDGGVARLSVGTARPVRDAGHLARLFAEDLGRLDPGFGIEALALSLPVVEPLAPGQKALPVPGAEAGQEALFLLVDRLGARLGERRVFRPAPWASHVPERAVRPAHPLSSLRPGEEWAPAPRPPHLLPTPEPVETSPAPPDAPPPFGGRPPAGGLPSYLRWRRQVLRLRSGEGPERIAAEWWHGPSPPPPDAVRDYWRVEDDQGRRLWLFRTPGSEVEAWFVHALLP